MPRKNRLALCFNIEQPMAETKSKADKKKEDIRHECLSQNYLYPFRELTGS